MKWTQKEPKNWAKSTEEMKHFYDTIPQTPQEAITSESRAVTQEDRIYDAMKLTGQEWTAWGLKTYMFWEMEITSIRRALFNLEKQGKIQRSGWVKGPKGVKVGKYIAFTGKLF